MGKVPTLFYEEAEEILSRVPRSSREMAKFLKTAGMLMLGLALLAGVHRNFRVFSIHSRVYGDLEVSWQVGPAMFVWQAASSAKTRYSILGV